MPISITVQLRNIARSGKLTKVKNSFKLSEEFKKSVKPKPAKPVKPKSLANKLASKPKATFGLKKVQKHVKTPAKVTKVLKVSELKPAASTKKVKKATVPVKKGATVKKEAPAKKLATTKKLAKAIKRVAPPKPKKAMPSAKKAKK